MPNDGFYYVLRGKEILGRHKTLKKATEQYNKLMDEDGVSREVAPVSPEEMNERNSNYYVYGKFNKKKTTKTRTYS